jgi:hypothetical protein
MLQIDVEGGPIEEGGKPRWARHTRPEGLQKAGIGSAQPSLLRVELVRSRLALVERKTGVGLRSVRMRLA